MSYPARPLYCCRRPDGTVTQLIAVDELSPQFNICGLPRRSYGLYETEGMTCLGTFDFPKQLYIVESRPAQAPMYSPPSNLVSRLPPNSNSRDNRVTVVTEENLPLNQGLAVPSMAPVSQPNAMNPQNSASPWGAAQGEKPAPKQGRRSRRKKVYCSFWLRNGECDYEQQGCRFKHEMPKDLKTLESLGLRDIPHWFRAKHGLPSLLPYNHDSQPYTGDGNPFLAPPNAVQIPNNPGPEAAVYIGPAFQPNVAMVGRQPQPAYGHPQEYRFSGNTDLLSGDSLPAYPPLDPICRATTEVRLTASVGRRENGLTHGQDRVLGFQSSSRASGVNHANVHSSQTRYRKASKTRRTYDQQISADPLRHHTSSGRETPLRHVSDLTPDESKRSDSISPRRGFTRRSHRVARPSALPAIGSEMINSANNRDNRRDVRVEEVDLVEFDGYN